MKFRDCWECKHAYTDYHDEHDHLVVRCEYGEKTSARKECEWYE